MGEREAQAIDALVASALDKDDEDDERWAIVRALQDASRARLDDPDADTCMEALAGLARRCDPGVIKALQGDPVVRRGSGVHRELS